MSSAFKDPRPYLLGHLQTLSGDALACTVIANGVWGDTPAYSALAERLDQDTFLGLQAAEQLSVAGPPLVERPKPEKMMGTIFEGYVLDLAKVLAKRCKQEAGND
jgi:hypothetical protein